MMDLKEKMEMALIRSYLAWAVAQIEYMNDGKELSESEWDEDAAMFWQAKALATLSDRNTEPQPDKT